MSTRVVRAYSSVDRIILIFCDILDTREMTGKGFTFLNIPRSYYGRLTANDIDIIDGVTKKQALGVLHELKAKGLCDADGIVKLDIKSADVMLIIKQAGIVPDSPTSTKVQTKILRARYSNLYALLREHLSPETYLQIVRNKILVDIQVLHFNHMY